MAKLKSDETGIELASKGLARTFYDHIVRDEQELQQIRLYISQNPADWEYDRENRQFHEKTGDPQNNFGLENWMI